eukprot:850792-Amphidinium_carterae.1
MNSNHVGVARRTLRGLPHRAESDHRTGFSGVPLCSSLVATALVPSDMAREENTAYQDGSGHNR